MTMMHAGYAVLLSAAAGAATALGGAAAVWLRPSRRILAAALGFAGGVMVSVSLADLLPQAAKTAAVFLGGAAGAAAVTLAMALGMAVSLFMEWFLPEQSGDANGLWRLGLLSMSALLLHNLPEGMAVFVGAGADRSLGLSLAGAIALHNFPEGISVAMPVWAATGSRAKAIGMAALSGAAEPIGALLTWIFTGGNVGELTLAVLFAAIAGLMTCLSFAQLFPGALAKSTSSAAAGALLGTLVMIFSLCMV